MRKVRTVLPTKGNKKTAHTICNINACMDANITAHENNKSKISTTGNTGREVGGECVLSLRPLPLSFSRPLSLWPSVSRTYLCDDEAEDEPPENLGEEYATCLVQGLVHEQHLMLVCQVAGEKVRDAHHEDERVDDRVR